MRADGIFIAVEISDELAGDADLAAKLAEACPVDIFAVGDDGGGVQIVQDNLDECVLCGLCLVAVGGRDGRGDRDPIPLDVIKLYDEGAKLAV
jgi:NAD-dependent dihydropyrimidine dehydrogenase PreA subunit